jgi:hypothetical protein
MKSKNDIAVMGYTTLKLGEYAEIKLGDGFPQAIRTIAENNGDTPQRTLRLLIDSFVETVKEKASNCK